jgi:hypothetical protein
MCENLSCRQESFNLCHHAIHFLLIGEGDHENFVACRLRLRDVRYRNFLNSLEGLRSVSNIVHGVKNLSAVIPGSACVTNPNDHIFQDDESLFMLKGLPLNLLGTNGSFAIFAPITVQ